MCDEYDDERMRAFWRAVAEGKDAAILPKDEEPLQIIGPPLSLEPTPVKRRPQRLLTR